MDNSRDINILIGVTGGIAVYKILEVISQLKKIGGYNIKVVMTDNATKFVSPLTFSTMTGNKIYTSLWDENFLIPHIKLANNTDIFLIAPGTYNIIGKIANGIADDLLSTIASAVQCRKIIAPAMNVNMYLNKILQENLKKLQNLNWEIIPPDEGVLACNDIGKGKLATPEEIIKHISYIPNNTKLKGKKVLITAGGTIENIDPVRYITNRSSGKMGISIVKEAKRMGAEVLLIYGNVAIEIPSSINALNVNSAMEMKDAVLENFSSSDIIIMAAAVSDYRLKNISKQKIKKTNDLLILELVKNPDILFELSKLDKKNKIIVGFAAETNDLETNALEKLHKKKLDMIIANDVSRKDSGFSSPNNKVIIYYKNGEKQDLPLMSKNKVSKYILSKIVEII